ncbi:MAG TPA: hypothetical protein VFQ43_17690 [Nitrososphaera sp.]|nr:hypothetical protein [Nitrososphaera sp.]
MPQQLTYRRLRDEIFWHLYQECKYWPTANYEEVTTEHPPGELSVQTALIGTQKNFALD